MGVNLDDLLGIDNFDPKVVAAEQDRSDYRALVEGLVALRKQSQLTQAEVAKVMETTQSVVSSFEQAATDARFSTVQRYSRAVGARLRCLHTIEGGRRFTVPTATGAADIFYGRAASR